MLKKTVMALCVSLALSLSAKDKTYYVDCQMDSYADHNGSSWELAYETIQEAIDKASNDDTILVKPGVYNKGSGKQVASWGEARIGWNNKRLRIKSTGCAAETIIEGQQNFDAENGGSAEGNGTNTMHCLAVYHNNETSYGSTVQGFTFRKGATELSITDAAGNKKYGRDGTSALQNQATSGGAVCVGISCFYFADCVFEDNTALNSVLSGGCYIRCRITNNTQEKGSTMLDGKTSNGVKSTYYACVIDHNRNSSQSGNTGNIYSGIMVLNSDLYHCTAMENWFGSFCYNASTTNNNCLFWNAGALAAASTYNNCVNDGTEKFPVMSTLFADVRLIQGCAAQTAGDPSNLETMTIPTDVWEVVGRKDFSGAEIPTEGTVAAGASQVAVTPQYGGVATYGYGTTVDGVPSRDGTYSYVYATAYPTQFVFSADVTDPTKRLAYVHFKKDCPGALETYDYRFPDRQDKLVVMPPPTVAIMTNDNTVIDTVVYTHPDAVAAEADGTRAHPYRTIQAALDADKKMVVALAGTYAEGVTDNATSGKSRIQTASVARITSEEGPEKTVIKGAPSTDASADAHGNGPGAVRCLCQNGNMTQFQGFTLTDGHTDLSGGNKTLGGAAYNTSNYLWLDDCIITNNTAKEGIVRGAKVQRSYIAGNYAYDYVVTACILNGSVVENNDYLHPQNGILGDGSFVIHSTIILPKQSGIHPWVNKANVRRFMSLFIGGDTADASGKLCSGNVYSEMISVLDTTGGVNAKVLLADPANGDYTPFKDSATLTAPQPFTADNYGKEYWFYARTYYDGTPIAFKNGDTPIASGAIPSTTTKRIVALEAPFGGVSPADDRQLVTGDSITLTEASCPRPITGVKVGDEERLFADGPVVITAAEAAGGVLASAIYPNAWYVDATSGDDANDGFMPARAMKTLAAVFAKVIPGDTVYAAEGVYNSGTMKAKPDYIIESRVVITNNASLVATGRQSETVIEGKYADTPAKPIGSSYRTDWGMRGIGQGAVKCVTLMAGASVRGFTLRNGFTDMRVEGKKPDESGEFGSGSHNDNCGGALYADASNGRNNCWAEDCFVTNCGAYRGGGVMGVKCKNCVFVDNLAGYGGGAMSDGYAYGCISRDNHCQFPYRRYHSGLFYMYEVDGCTVLDGYSPCGDASVVGRKNTLFAGYFSLGGAEYSAAKSWNCAFPSETAYDEDSALSKEGFQSLIESHHLVVAPKAELATDDEGRPLLGANAAIDKGDPTLSTYLAETDVFGGQRVYNGALDIGAAEADWRPVYSKDLHRRATTVTEASPMVKEVGADAKSLRLQDGDTLVVKVQAYRASFSIPVDVRNGTLTLSVDGGEPLAYQAASTITLDKASEERTLAFTFEAGAGEGDKLATIGRFKGLTGMAVFLR